VHPETRGGKNPSDGRKVSGVIHWVDAATAVPAEVRLYDRLFKAARPEDGGADFVQQLDPRSFEVVPGARVEAGLAGAAVGSRWQLERIGYFAVDQDSRPGALVLNRIVTLRESYAEARPEARPAITGHVAGTLQNSSGASSGAVTTDKIVNAKAKTRPRSKSPIEYRAEARARDPELSAGYARAKELVSAESADLLTGDLATARLFLAVAQRARPETAAKWIINELPRALGDAPGGRDSEGSEGETPGAGRNSRLEQIAPAELGALLAAVDDGSLPTSSAKTVLTELVRTGKSFAELRAGVAAPAKDLGPAIDAVIAANPDKAAQYKAGKTGLLGFFVGQVMKSAPGSDAAAVNKVLRERLV
jgi:glutaminyl-tRNA synthetase